MLLLALSENAAPIVLDVNLTEFEALKSGFSTVRQVSTSSL